MTEQRVKVAAVQFEGVPGRVADNLERLRPWVARAVQEGAEVIALPEFFASPLPFKQVVHDSVMRADNPAVAFLRDTARRHGVTIGGSMLIVEGDSIYNRYHLVEPDGRIHLHDKDLPTMWEGAFYGPGADDGVFDTALGGVGTAVCWELIRTGTAQRMLGRVGLVMSGTHWWTVPDNWGGLTARALARLAAQNRRMSDQAPSQFALHLGVPVVQASHCGQFDTDFMLVPGWRKTLPYRTEFVGATQIVDAGGQVLARRDTREGPGLVMASVALGQRAPAQPLPNRFWLPPLPPLMRAYWHQQNACAKRYYEREGRARGLAAALSKGI